MSLDGYLADDHGGYDRTVPVATPTLDTEHQLPFDEFLDEVDIVATGRHCRSPARLVKVTGAKNLRSVRRVHGEQLDQAAGVTAGT
ncbi:hypothetical protein AB0L34_05775 [Micromonospora sp. NPDC052213]|uniref:hypothetical protein n=1 Tax=Micromonospora sp. NPDC052213 TaxID=3155812 RepID=UPI00342FA95D